MPIPFSASWRAPRARLAPVVVFVAAAFTAPGEPTMAKPPVALVAGDIAQGTGGSRDRATSDLILRRRGAVLTAGDNVQGNGAFREFRRWYHPTWGRFKGRTYPTPGNHEYRTPGARGYFRYFGPRAGPQRRGYYTLRLGSWRVISLDSEPCMSLRGCGRGTPQYRWLAGLLARASERCTLAVWHRPLFSSGGSGGQPRVRPIARLLYQHGAEVVVNGHDHLYERFAPARPSGRLDRRFGIRQFTVGTGGARLGPRGAVRVPHSELRQARAHGVLRLVLRRASYEWRFLPIKGQTFTDSGSGRCHGKPRRG